MKASSSYLSIVQGVSQQVPQNRAPGQCTEMVNMIPDPVEGVSRRHGSKLVAERQQFTLSPDNMAAYQADTDNWRTFEYSNGGNTYVLFVRRAAKPGASDLPVILGYNKTTGEFLSVVPPFVSDTALDQLINGGVSAITAVGKYVFMAGNTIVPTATSTDKWGNATNQARAAVWVRGGAYSRKFSVTATRTDNVQISFDYTTPTSSYPGTLDTSGVPVYAADPTGGTTLDTEAAYITLVGSFGEATLGWAAWNPTGMTVKDGTTTLTNVSPADPANASQYRWDAGSSFVRFHSSMVGQLDVTMSYTHTKTITNPNFSKQVADITNAYNTAVTQWIGTAAAAIQPEAIAEALKNAAIAAGLTTATRVGSHVIFDNVKGLTVDDGGDGSLIRGVANEISSIDDVTDYHYVGKVVKVRANGSDKAFYLVATAKDPSVTAGVTEIVWVEGAGVEHAVTSALVYATVVGTSLYIASSATLLATITPGPHPEYVNSVAGDSTTSPLPDFIGKTITFLATFQDRLLIGSRAVVQASAIGDYLNFFPASILTVLADGAFNVTAKNSEDDILRHAVEYDRDLVIFGDKRQYALSGRSVMTPTNPSMQIISAHPNASAIPPLAVGGYIMYGKVGQRSSSVHQIQPGLNPEQPESYPASSQLNDYISGRVIELADNAEPAAVFLRTTGKRNSVYAFHYVDSPQEGRRQAAWGRWDFDAALGLVIGFNRTPDGLLVFFLRPVGDEVWLVADLCSLTAGLSSYPYLDSLRAWDDLGAGSVQPDTAGPWHVAFDDTTQFFLHGEDLAAADALFEEYSDVPTSAAWVGADMATDYTPTNPFMRDRNGAAITTGLLTVTRMVISLSESSGFTSTVTDSAGSNTRTFSGRILGGPNNLIGIIPVTTGDHSVTIGRESRTYTMKLEANSWYPLTITALEWVGSFFNRTQRV